uniref:perlucin-like protein n=1 Tax=Styela clava TaxID=7725 RepID=UPI0019392A17|nr:perlucin-like protein [Styela clava]
MKYTFFAVILLFNITNSSAQDPWKKKCVDGFELPFFKERKHYEEAKKSCEELEGYLAKVDNERITAAIKSLIDISETEMGFFIGGTDRANVEDWKWQDGTDVNMRGETGYQNWFVIWFNLSCSNKKLRTAFLFFMGPFTSTEYQCWRSSSHGSDLNPTHH